MPKTSVQITHTEDGATIVNGERLIRTEWVDNTLFIVTPNHEYRVENVSFDAYLAMLDLGDE